MAVQASRQASEMFFDWNAFRAASRSPRKETSGKVNGRPDRARRAFSSMRFARRVTNSRAKRAAVCAAFFQVQWAATCSAPRRARCRHCGACSTAWRRARHRASGSGLNHQPRWSSFMPLTSLPKNSRIAGMRCANSSVAKSSVDPPPVQITGSAQAIASSTGSPNPSPR